MSMPKIGPCEHCGRSDVFGQVSTRTLDDAAYRLAQAQLLCPNGWVVVPVEPPMEVLAAARYPQAAFIFYREIIAYARNAKWEAKP